MSRFYFYNICPLYKSQSHTSVWQYTREEEHNQRPSSTSNKCLLNLRITSSVVIYYLRVTIGTFSIIVSLRLCSAFNTPLYKGFLWRSCWKLLFYIYLAAPTNNSTYRGFPGSCYQPFDILWWIWWINFEQPVIVYLKTDWDFLSQTHLIF